MAKALTLEEYFASIEQAVAALESGEVPLEEALARYEAGIKAVRLAKAMLDRYTARLEELRADPERPAGSDTDAS
jgi:exodeoxyribonuclease VII small subunit